jgi:hypothetical protein
MSVDPYAVIRLREVCRLCWAEFAEVGLRCRGCSNAVARSRKELRTGRRRGYYEDLGVSTEPLDQTDNAAVACAWMSRAAPCIRCHARPRLRERKSRYCVQCWPVYLAQSREGMRRLREYRRAQGLCWSCGGASKRGGSCNACREEDRRRRARCLRRNLVDVLARLAVLERDFFHDRYPGLLF